MSCYCQTDSISISRNYWKVNIHIFNGTLAVVLNHALLKFTTEVIITLHFIQNKAENRQCFQLISMVNGYIVLSFKDKS